MANSHSLARLIRATGFSWAGLVAAWRHEPAFREEVLLSILLTPVAFWLGSDATERSLLLGSLFIVLIAELLNSALETLTDRFSTERHALSGRVKDLGSAAVFVSMVLVVIIWSLIAWQRFFS